MTLGISAAAGTSDFLGGTCSREIGTLRLLLCTLVIGLLIAGAWVPVQGKAPPSADTIALSAGAGAALTVSLLGFFQGMAVGAVSIVAPISATGAVLPLLVGLLTGEPLTVLQAPGLGARYSPA